MKNMSLLSLLFFLLLLLMTFQLTSEPLNLSHFYHNEGLLLFRTATLSHDEYDKRD